MARKTKAQKRRERKARRNERALLLKTAADSAKVFEAAGMVPPHAGDPGAGTARMGPRSPVPVNGSLEPAKACHLGPKHVFRVDDLDVEAGARTEVRFAPGIDVLLSCCGTAYTPSAIMTVNQGAKELFPTINTISQKPCIAIDWPDMDVPSLTAKHWADLANALRTHSGTLGVFCEGGHGRTGTALTILAHHWGLIPEGDCPVSWLRKIYCDSAVETYEQCRYIEDMTGRTVTATGHYDHWFSGYGTASEWDIYRGPDAMKRASGATDLYAAGYVKGDDGIWRRKEGTLPRGVECVLCGNPALPGYVTPGGNPGCATHGKPNTYDGSDGKRAVVNASGDVLYHVPESSYPYPPNHREPLVECPECKKPAESYDVEAMGSCVDCFLGRERDRDLNLDDADERSEAQTIAEAIARDRDPDDMAPLDAPERPWLNWTRSLFK